MLSNHLKNLQRFKYDRKQHSSEDIESDDDYLPLDISTSISTMTKSKNTEALIGIQQKSQRLIDWLPVLSIILAAIICLIAIIVLCKQQIDHHRFIYSQLKRRRNNRNRNNNQTSLITVDVAECIDDDIEFVEGLHILLAKGSLILNDNDAQMLNAMNTFDRLQYFQKLANQFK